MFPAWARRTWAICLLACATPFVTAQIVPDEIYNRSGFQPYWDLGAQPQFDCVGKFSTAGGGTGVWLGGPYVLYVAHGCGTWKKTRYEPTPASDFRFLMVKNGRQYSFQGKAWHIPRGAWAVDEDTSKPVRNRLPGAWDAMDFCVIELSQTPNIPGVVPAELADEKNEVGLDTVWVGFGTRGVASVGSNRQIYGDGGTDRPIRKMGWQNRIDSLDDWGWKLVSTFDRNGLPLEGHQAKGSSGGGVFAKVGASWKLVGLACNGQQMGGHNESLKANGSMYGATAGAGRVKAFRKELLEGLAGNWSAFESIGVSRLNGHKSM